MSTYAIIDTGSEQLQVEPGRFYDVRYFASLKSEILAPNTKILIYRVLLIRHESAINLGHPWVKDAIVRGRILHPSFGDRITIYKKHSKKKKRRKLGYRQDLVRFVVDSICLNGKEL
uniref:Large ribosomal subunit protein bL21c n=1 Tax=Christensenia aesculifolia TaxID=491817 RepID=A0A5C0F558_9MONI|nr:ribosomal protein L21 [Christensenia aesculifolia]QEI60376.1 ribosomal protein L21 [Christensenia aesculifolia]